MTLSSTTPNAVIGYLNMIHHSHTHQAPAGQLNILISSISGTKVSIYVKKFKLVAKDATFITSYASLANRFSHLFRPLRVCVEDEPGPELEDTLDEYSLKSKKSFLLRSLNTNESTP